MSINFILPSEARAKLRISKSKEWAQKNEGSLVSNISNGKRSKVYLEHEINAIMAARASGWESGQIKELVTKLEAQRKEILNSALAVCTCVYKDA